jgi:AraC-like DNA-binding protein
MSVQYFAGRSAVLSFSTDDIAPGDRFEHWREVRSKSLFGVTIELEHERRASFAGRFSAGQIGGATVTNMQASPYTISRTKADIARMPGNSITMNRQVRGQGVLDVGREITQKVGEGDIIFGHSDMPFTATPQRHEGFDYRMLRIPLEGDIVLGANVENLLATTSAQMRFFSRPISALFNALTSARPQLDDPASTVTHIAWLFLLERGRLKLGLSESRAALRAGLYHAAREVLARDLHRYELSPSGVAGELGVSLRQLHVLFEPSGRSFSRTLADMRIARAFYLFEAQPRLSIAEVAHACGMESQATFYRAFRNSFEMTPGDRQALVRGK